MIDILIYGINGLMGRTVYSCVADRSDVNVVCGVDKHTVGDFNCPVYTSALEYGKHFDAIIDFSSPSSLKDIINSAREHKCALILATTGYTESQIQAIKEVSKEVPICLSSNFSSGITAVKKILPTLKRLLPGFDVSISETHRKEKRDKPSGTAIALNECVEDSAEMHSVRGGDVPGIHEICFLGERESVSIKHVSYSREVFAKGAIDACVRLVKLPAGMYTELI